MAKQRVLILCGFIGSGKSTFAAAVKQYRGDHWVVLCQDVLKRKQKVLEAMEAALKNGKSVIIDRQNLDFEQRSPYFKMAAEHSIGVDLVRFNCTFEECEARVATRVGHPTLYNVEKARTAMAYRPRYYEPCSYERYGHDIVFVTTPAGIPRSPYPRHLVATFPWTKEAIDEVFAILDSEPLPYKYWTAPP